MDRIQFRILPLYKTSSQNLSLFLSPQSCVVGLSNFLTTISNAFLQTHQMAFTSSSSHTSSLPSSSTMGPTVGLYIHLPNKALFNDPNLLVPEPHYGEKIIPDSKSNLFCILCHKKSIHNHPAIIPNHSQAQRK